MATRDDSSAHVLLWLSMTAAAGMFYILLGLGLLLVIAAVVKWAWLMVFAG